MASKTVVAFEFFFEAKKMKELLDTNPNKVMCIVSIVEEVTQDGRKVGALKITATGTFKEGELGELVIDGCPRPPCGPQEFI